MTNPDSGLSATLLGLEAGWVNPKPYRNTHTLNPKPFRFRMLPDKSVKAGLQVEPKDSTYRFRSCGLHCRVSGLRVML